MPIPLLSILKFKMYIFLASKENIHSGMGCVDRKFKSCHQLQITKYKSLNYQAWILSPDEEFVVVEIQ